jgi:hypothetical protein
LLSRLVHGDRAGKQEAVVKRRKPSKEIGKRRRSRAIGFGTFPPEKILQMLVVNSQPN